MMLWAVKIVRFILLGVILVGVACKLMQWPYANLMLLVGIPSGLFMFFLEKFLVKRSQPKVDVRENSDDFRDLDREDF